MAGDIPGYENTSGRCRHCDQLIIRGTEADHKDGKCTQ